MPYHIENENTHVCEYNNNILYIGNLYNSDKAVNDSLRLVCINNVSGVSDDGDTRRLAQEVK